MYCMPVHLCYTSGHTYVYINNMYAINTMSCNLIQHSGAHLIIAHLVLDFRSSAVLPSILRSAMTSGLNTSTYT